MEAKANKETEDQRSTRLQREAAELAKSWPTKSSTCRIFVWEEDLGGIWTRTYTSNRRGREIWQGTAPSHRRYNSFRNEWDVCVEFDPAGAPDSEDEEGLEWWGQLTEREEVQNDIVGQDSLPLFAPTPRALSQSPSPSFYMEPRWSDAYGMSSRPVPSVSPEPRRQVQIPMASRRSCSPRYRPSLGRRRTPPSDAHASPAAPLTRRPSPGADEPPERSDVNNSVAGLSLATALWQRYGIAPNTTGYITPPAILSTHVADLKVRKIMAHTSETIPHDFSVSAIDFVCALSFKAQDAQGHPTLPPCLSDMIPGNARGYPRNQQARKMLVRPCLTPSGEAWYVITSSTLSSEKDVCWVLAVHDPLTVNQILRENRGPSVFHVCQYLLENGIHFKTLAAHPCPVSWLWPSKPMPLFYKNVPLALGARMDRDFTVEDYEAYTDQRDAIIKSHRGRAAFLRGGIVWRLARECMSYEDVLMGPSGCHTREDYINLDGMGFVDDELSEHELAVICGTYRVLPGKFVYTSLA